MPGFNLPDGVTGNEFQIAGPDYERESDELCEVMVTSVDWATGDPVDMECGEPCMEIGYGFEHWLQCEAGHITELPDVEYEPDPDEAYDRMRLGE